PYAGEITLRGDTDFTLTAELDRWDGQGIKFIFGMDAHPKVVQLAEALPEEAWKPLERLPRYEIATEPRRKAPRIKEAIVRFKGYLNKKLVVKVSRSLTINPISAGAVIGWWWCAKTSVSRKGKMYSLKTSDTSSISLTTPSTVPNRSWLWLTSAAIKRM